MPQSKIIWVYIIMSDKVYLDFPFDKSIGAGIKAYLVNLISNKNHSVAFEQILQKYRDVKTDKACIILGWLEAGM